MNFTQWFKKHEIVLCFVLAFCGLLWWLITLKHSNDLLLVQISEKQEKINLTEERNSLLKKLQNYQNTERVSRNKIYEENLNINYKEKDILFNKSKSYIYLLTNAIVVVDNYFLFANIEWDATPDEAIERVLQTGIYSRNKDKGLYVTCGTDARDGDKIIYNIPGNPLFSNQNLILEYSKKTSKLLAIYVPLRSIYFTQMYEYLSRQGTPFREFLSQDFMRWETSSNTTEISFYAPTNKYIETLGLILIVNTENDIEHQYSK